MPLCVHILCSVSGVAEAKSVRLKGLGMNLSQLQLAFSLYTWFCTSIWFGGMRALLGLQRLSRRSQDDDAMSFVRYKGSKLQEFSSIQITHTSTDRNVCH